MTQASLHQQIGLPTESLSEAQKKAISEALWSRVACLKDFLGTGSQLWSSYDYSEIEINQEQIARGVNALNDFCTFLLQHISEPINLQPEQVIKAVDIALWDVSFTSESILLMIQAALKLLDAPQLSYLMFVNDIKQDLRKVERLFIQYAN